jgi:uncharacterized membrane protein YhaH (DUF805 family)
LGENTGQGLPAGRRSFISMSTIIHIIVTQTLNLTDMEKHESSFNMVDWWKKVVLKNYANFNGRARRAEYWWFTLANFLILIPFYIIGVVGTASDSAGLSIFGLAVYVLLALGTIIPSLAVGVRRLHDLNKSGWNYLFALIPLIGSILLLVWFCTEGTKGENNYGDDPKNPGTPNFDFDQRQ